MQDTKSAEKKGYKNFLLAIFDAWLLFNQQIPKKIEEEKVRAEIKEERARKLGPRLSDKDKFFSPKEISLIKKLVSDPRKSYLELANELELSRHTVKKKIERMLNSDKMRFCVGINYNRLDIDLLFVDLTLNNLKYLEEIFQELQNCPRIFLITKNIARSNLQVLFGVEKTSNHPNQYVSIIEKLQLDERVKECNIISLNPELFPKFLLFTTFNLPEQGTRAPCGMNCKICEKYVNHICPGCPGIEGYQGQLFKMIK